ncbi:Polyketide synthase [Mycena sanguinolenta]|uniref:Polyketide synthase n=1 Tax=Mycena sanguinolenta TaxID=230812 RepID=A0A8H6XTX1_9AGAR|nr:Polyketide synthase [Mycena sanguinolenta]
MINANGIAIVGIAAQLPAGPSATEDLDYASFWDFLVKGQKAYEPLENIIPESVRGAHVKLPAQGAFLKNATSFDNIALGISTRDARIMPNSARRLLDLSFQALLDSGSEIDADGSFAWMPHSIANRISYVLDLTGPSIHIDTACSSSLTALHLAINAIEQGDCSAALVGAAQINRDPFEWVTSVQGGVLGPDGECKPLSDNADGFGRGEGAIVIVIKPLQDALKSNDHIYSVILGSAINATGSHMPLSVPNGVAQQWCIAEAYKKSGLNPQDADYIELHATGTAVGDPIEGNAHFSAFQSAEQSSPPVQFGTVKGNIGHLEVAAFLGSLVKACLMFEHGLIPPTVNFCNPTRAITWDNFRVTVPIEPTALGCRSSSGRAVISLSGSGLGGATGHVVLQAPPAPIQPSSQVSTAPVLILVGGLSSGIVDRISEAALRLVTSDPSTLLDCAVTLSRRARQLPWRTYFTLAHSPSSIIPPATLVPKEHSPLVFVFSGQGPQHLEMGRQLFAEYPVFRNTILELDDVYRRVKGVSLTESTGLFAPRSIPVGVANHHAARLRLAGHHHHLMLGHSTGETAILYTSGAGPKAMAMEIAIARGESMTCTESQDVGMAMLACDAGMGAELVARATSGNNGIAELSCFNAPDSIVVSGTMTLLDAIVALAQSEGLFAQRIRTMVPGHSSFMDCIQDDYLARMESIFTRYPGPHTPQIPVLSTCRTERFVEAFTPQYFWDNCRNAVLFSDAITHSLESSPFSPIFLEISCHPVLSSSILARGVADNRVLCPMRRISAKKTPVAASSNEPVVFLETLGRLSLLGVNSLDLSGLYGFSAFKSKLIGHPLTARVISPPKSHSPFHRFTSDNKGPLSSSNLRISRSSHPDMAQHIINGEPILPATGFIELLLEAGANFLWDVEFQAILSIASPTPLDISLQRLDSAWSVTSSAGSREREHARGFMDKSPPNSPPTAIDFTEIFERLPRLDFGSEADIIIHGFSALTSPRQPFICHSSLSLLMALNFSEFFLWSPLTNSVVSLQGYVLHPVVMDACLHVMLHTDISKQYSKGIMYLPSRLQHFMVYRRKFDSGNWFSHIRLRQWTPDARYYDVMVTDSSGLALCELRNLMVRKFTAAPPMIVNRRFDLIFQPVAVNVDIPAVDAFFPEREDNAERQLLFRLLGFPRSRDDIYVFGSGYCDRDGLQESRQRYLTFARRAAQHPTICVAPEVLKNLRDKWPHHFEITSRISSIHSSVFETPRRAVDALYSDGLMANFYSKANQTSNVCLEATKTFAGILASLRMSGKRAIKILEVGAGTGLLTYHLIDELKQNPDLLVEYTVTDISYALVANLARSISYGSIIPKAYDIGKSPDEQEIYSESYDVVVSLHVLHTASSVRDCLRSLQGLLVPGGVLLTVELDGTGWVGNPGSVWFDCIFGSFPEWFGYSDGRDHCSISPATWKEHLEAVDYINVQTSVDRSTTGRDFFFVAQKPHSCSTGSFEHAIDSGRIHRYTFGEEMELQTQLRHYDLSASVTIYLLAMVGQDADAATGLCAALRREVPLWDIRLCIFKSSTDITNPIPLLSAHITTFNSGENVALFDTNGAAHVSRVSLSPAPPAPSLHADINDPNYITVRISHWAGTSGVYDGFVGQVDQGSHPVFHPGDVVGGVVQAASGDVIRVHANNIIPVAQSPHANLARNLLASVVTSLIHFPPSTSKMRTVIAVQDDGLAQVLGQRLSNRPQIRLVSSDFRNPNVTECLDILLTDSATYSQYPNLRRWLPRTGQALLSDKLLAEKILKDPLYIRKTLAGDPELRPSIPAFSSERELTNGVHCKSALTNGDKPPSPPITNGVCAEPALTNGHAFSSLPSTKGIHTRPLTFRAAPPFREDRVYVLLGGIGGLGIDLAVWMYQHGARHLVLTSRRGMQSLDPVGDAITLAKLAYLESQEDLEIALERCDATSDREMSYLIDSLPLPIAGCFHMTLVLSDAPFFKQTADTFRTLSDSKLRVFEIFSNKVDVDSLDFFIAFSSISGLLGVMGQTNYASACTSLDGVLARHRKAFSMITPGISDAGYLDRAGSKHIRETFASISAEALWTYLEDALRKLDDQPFNQYIPDLDWTSLNVRFPLPMMCRHLSSPLSRPTVEAKPRQLNGEDILGRVLELLEVSPDEFDVTQPLTTYGLDSLSATKLASILPLISNAASLGYHLD